MPARTARRELLRGAATLAVLSCIPSGWALPPGPPRGPAFIEALIARMSVEEKAGQLSLFSSAEQVDKAINANPASKDGAGRNQLAAARARQLTGVFNGANVRWHRQLQEAALTGRSGGHRYAGRAAAEHRPCARAARPGAAERGRSWSHGFWARKPVMQLPISCSVCRRPLAACR
ncbi:hypothetical protein [Xanthomonas arboricola]|uniref:hypothetical protein n=1 Tax=Xanthomonas arboricola TaxID=56448 RepID=UPI001EE8388F|nr:hypothetical protein [Xanthomonas arboricola]